MATKSTTTRSRAKKPSASKSGEARKPPDTRSEWTVGAGEVGIRVRMYRVGFGDFFLITFREDGKQAHVIVDCGVFKGTSQTGDIKSIQAAVADMIATTGQQVALIIMTHRHADHIAGFGRCKADYQKLTVGGVWMPIWESEFDPTAKKFQAELTRTALALQSHFMAAAAAAVPSEEENTARKFMENATGLSATDLAAAKGGSGGPNAVALNLLKNELKGVTAVHYYQAGDTAKLPKDLADIGVTAQILGPPPIKDLDLMKLMDLKKGVGQYLADPELASGDERPPFVADWEVPPLPPQAADQASNYSPEVFKEWVQPRAWKEIAMASALAAQPLMEAALQKCQPIASLLAAKQLNSFLNNQSLVVLFGFKGKKLLFVGDAQAGNWEHWLFETDTPDKLASGTMSAQARQILDSIDFYKVGHHGSSNATPKIVAEALTQNSHGPACMCSTEKDVYGTEDPEDPAKGTEVPRIPLLAKLQATKAFVRSDQIDIKFNSDTQSAEAVQVKAQVSAKLPPDSVGRRFEQGALWIDCFL